MPASPPTPPEPPLVSCLTGGGRLAARGFSFRRGASDAHSPMGWPGSDNGDLDTKTCSQMGCDAVEVLAWLFLSHRSGAMLLLALGQNPIAAQPTTRHSRDTRLPPARVGHTCVNGCDYLVSGYSRPVDNLPGPW